MRDTFTGKERLAMNEEEKAGGDPYGDKKWEAKLAEKFGQPIQEDQQLSFKIEASDVVAVAAA